MVVKKVGGKTLVSSPNDQHTQDNCAYMLNAGNSTDVQWLQLALRGKS